VILEKFLTGKIEGTPKRKENAEISKRSERGCRGGSVEIRKAGKHTGIRVRYPI
jgi:hypothetical protein